MVTLLLGMNSKQEQEQTFAIASEFIKSGKLVAFPTETVYGLGANALDKHAVAKIFEAKKRPHWDPLIVHVDSLEMMYTLASIVPYAVDMLLDQGLMPGPISVLLPKAKHVPDIVTAGLDKVAVRMPSNPIARELIKQSGVPIAAPSANRFMHTSPTTAAHVLNDLEGSIDAVIDGGPTDVGVESTVLDLTTSIPTILRPGGITREQLEEVFGKVNTVEKFSEGNESQASPGQLLRHYAPETQVELIEGTETALVEKILEDVSQMYGVFLPSNWGIPPLDHVVVFDWGNFEDTELLAKRLYEGLRFLESHPVAKIIIPLPPATGIGVAIRDRLIRAAHTY